MNKVVTLADVPVIRDMSRLGEVPRIHGVPQMLWCYWAGGEMSEVRVRSLRHMADHVQVPVFLVTGETFFDLEVSDFPIHPAFLKLSAVHQSDYVRTYLWHHYGGAWHDVKATEIDFSGLWEVFSDDTVYLLGRPETKGGPARVMDSEGRWMPDYWQYLISVIAWIGRPSTPFSAEMMDALNRYLDQHAELLSKYPGRHPREKKIESNTIVGRGIKQTYYLFSGRTPQYPIPWTLFGNIFHPLNLQYRGNVATNLPADLNKNAGIYHR